MLQKIWFRRAIFKCHPSTFIKNQIDLSKSAQMTIFLADNNVKVCGWWLLLSAPRWRHLATCGDNRDNREHLTLALELPTTLAAALVRLNCPGENKGWENISSFKYSWLAPSRPARLHYSARHPNSHITAAGHCRGTARCFAPSWVRTTAGQRHTLDAENDANTKTH